MFPFIFAENIDTFIDQDTSQPGAEILSLRQMADRPVAGLDRVLNGVCDIFVICKIRPGNFIHTLFIHFYQPDKCPSVALLCFCDKMFQKTPSFLSVGYIEIVFSSPVLAVKLRRRICYL